MPFQSRLFNAAIHRIHRWQDRVGHLWRQAQVQAAWGFEVLLYPLTRIGRSLRYGLEQRQAPSIADGANNGEAKQSSPSKIIRLFKRMGRRFFGTGVAPLGRLRQLPFTKPLQSGNRPKQSAACTQAKPESGASTFGTTALVNRVMAVVEHLGDRLKPFSAQLATLEPRQNEGGLTHHSSHNHPVKETSHQEILLSWLRAAANHFFGKDISGAHKTRKFAPPTAFIAPNQEGGALENRGASPWEPVASTSEAILGWIKAAINYFFGEGTSGAQTKLPGSFQQLEDPNILLPTTSFSVALLPGVGSLVHLVWQVIRRGMGIVMPWLGRDRTLPMALPLVSAPSGVGIAQPGQSFDLVDGPFLQPRPSLADASQRGSYSDGGLLTTSTNTLSPLKTTLIEVSATVVGYIETPLGRLWIWLDRVIRWLEDVLIESGMWLWRWIQRFKRYCLDCLS